MIGGDTAASAGSNRAAADHPPAQPLSLLAVLQQEFKGNSTVRRQAQARRSTAAGPQMKIWLGFIGGSTVCPLRVPRSAQLIRGLPQVCVRTACLYVSTFWRGAGYSESRTIAIAVRASCWLFLRWPSVPIVAKERNFYGKIMVKLGPGLKLAANGRRLPMKSGFTLTDALITDYRLYATMAVLSWLDRAERYETVLVISPSRTGFRHG